MWHWVPAFAGMTELKIEKFDELLSARFNYRSLRQAEPDLRQ